ncbi:hypothetical protein VNI00_004908 [Paramarasmius palmivorus]|uniref:DUF6535 domain-containing protein n=1 Tax=Paramarasmius palmivorus TaxID=297713 RepID=A0AAW0DJS8_9AGAR
MRITEEQQAAYYALNRSLHQEGREHSKVEESSESGPTATALDESFEKLQAQVTKYDNGLVKGWNDDIDTLLVFAGLFSAVVTAFLIESYQWLHQDPQETAIILLTRISQQLNESQPTSSEPIPFVAEASSIRINCFWFLSLILSLTSALFGLLSKQWLREHQRDVPTRTSAEDLALKQLRRDSFEKWGVASFLSALPILLEVALFLFFVGVLDLLRTLHPVPFGICLVAVAANVGLYFLTTILPTITIPRNQTTFIQRCLFKELAYQFICPYKSPQAWAVYKLSTTLTKLLAKYPSIDTKSYLRPLSDPSRAQTSNWSMLDLQVVRQFNEGVSVPFTSSWSLHIYELQAFQWAVTMFRDSPSMTPHLENVLSSLPPSVAVSVALGRWDVTMWRQVARSDMGRCLRHGASAPPELVSLPIARNNPLHYSEGIEMLFWHRYWNAYMEELQNISDPGDLKSCFQNIEESIAGSKLQHSKNYRFYIPFPLLDVLLSHKNPWMRKQSLRLLRYLEESWLPCPGYDENRHNDERIAFSTGLALHVYNSHCSELLTSKRGRAFIRSIHNDIAIRQLYTHDDFWWSGWQDAIRKVQLAGNLSPDYFVPLPRWNDHPPVPVPLPPNPVEAIRYSFDTIPSVRVTFDDSETNPHGDVNPLAAPVPNSLSHNVGEGFPLTVFERPLNGNATRDVEGGTSNMDLEDEGDGKQHLSRRNTSPGSVENLESHEERDRGTAISDRAEQTTSSLRDQERVGWNPTLDPNTLRIH